MANKISQKSIDAYYKRMRNIIEREGHMIQSVSAEVGKTPAYAYTIGNTGKDLPELLLIANVFPQVAMHILNDLNDIMIAQNSPLSGDIPIGGSFPVRIREASNEACTKWGFGALRYYEREHIPFLQVLLPDPSGVYQGDPAIDPAWQAPLV